MPLPTTKFWQLALPSLLVGGGGGEMGEEERGIFPLGECGGGVCF